MTTKGIILAGGMGTRLRPLTDFVCKQLLPVYDKPLIYYPLTSLILSGIKEVLIISTPKDTPILEAALGDGSSLGISIAYKVQEEPRGLADAFILGADFIDGSPVCLVLGDNILHIANFTKYMANALSLNEGATIFSFPVHDPERFGVVEVDMKTDEVISIEEKPTSPRSNLAAIGLYVYDETVVDKARSLKPSKRGEIEITDLNNLYLKDKKLKCKRLSRGNVWIDTGVFDSFVTATQLVQIIETKLGLKIGCPEEASYFMKNISQEQLLKLAQGYGSSAYGTYLHNLIKYDAIDNAA